MTERTTPVSPPAAPVAAPPPRRRVAQRFRSDPLTTTGWVIAVVVVLIAVFAPWLAPFPDDAGSASHPHDTLLPPSWEHPFGTDQAGRDVFSRVIMGMRVSPLIAVGVLLISVLIGLPLGLIAGYFGGIADEIIMRVTDVFLAIPALLLALAFAVVLPPSLTSTMIALAISWWPWYARLVRGQAASVAGRRFIEACRALGISRWRILFRHVLPNAVTPLIIQVAVDFGMVILVAAGMSFLGLGAQDPTPDWGLMVNDGKDFISTHWWLVTFPGAAILIVAVAFNLIGDGLRDRLDPKRMPRL